MGATKARRSWRDSIRLFALLALLIGAVAALPASQAGAAKKAPPGDPPGNNGTIKIEQQSASDEDLGNEPHGDRCRIWLEFYGFDAGQKAFITYTAQPPSGDKDTVVLEDKGPDGKSGREVSEPTSPAGGGKDKDAVVAAYNLADKVVEKQLKEQPKQGYHLKVTIVVKNSDGSDVPGGTKHKVFWLGPCPEEQKPPTTAASSTLRISKEQVGTGEGPFTFDLNCDHAPLNRVFTLKAGEKLDVPDVPPGTTCVVTETDKKGAQSTTITEDPPTGQADDGEVKTTAEKATIVKFKNTFPGTEVTPAPPDSDLRPPSGTPAGGGGAPGTSVGGTNTGTNPGTSVLGASETAPEKTATLPRTGGDPRPMTATGLCSLAAGLALLAGRRRRRA